MNRIMIALAMVAMATGASAAKPKGPTKAQVAQYEQARTLLGANDLEGSLKIFDSLCQKQLAEACKSAELVRGEQTRIAAGAAQNAEAERKKADFAAALAKRSAKDYEGAIAGFNTLCKEQITSACQNVAAVSMEQSDEILKAAKRPNGQDCSQAIIASDFCRPAMTQSVELLGRVCDPASTTPAIKSVCARQRQLQGFIAATDKQIGK